MKKIEYIHVPKEFPGLNFEELNKLGEKGWIMCGSEHLKQSVNGVYEIVGKIYVFYRQIEVANHYVIKLEFDDVVGFLGIEENTNVHFVEKDHNKTKVKYFESLNDAEVFLKNFIRNRKTSEEFRRGKIVYGLLGKCTLSIVDVDNLYNPIKSYELENLRE